VTLALVFLVFGILGAVLLMMNALLGPRRTNPSKEQPFECGSPPLQEGINPFPVKFYLVALLFLLFAVEVAFLFPWALVFPAMRGTALLVLAAYAAVLAGGFAYAWKKGAFEWD